MVFLLNTTFAQLPDDGVDNNSSPQIDNITELTKQAEQHFLNGEYNKSIEIYDNIGVREIFHEADRGSKKNIDKS